LLARKPQSELIDYKSVVESLSQFITILPSNAEPLIPYTLVRHIAINFWDEYLEATNSLIDPSNKEKTSCIHTAFAICILFFGKEIAENILIQMSKKISTDFIIILKSGREISYKTAILFGDFFICGLNQLEKSSLNESKKEEEALKLSRSHLLTYVNHITNYVNKNLDQEEDSVIISSLNQYLSKPHYNFNEMCFQTLKKDLIDTSCDTHLNKSYVYFFGILISSSEEEINFNHSFIIEQFYSSKYSNVRFRLYQSWIKRATLLDDFIKRDYKNDEENTWDQVKLMKFLDKFKKLYDTNNQSISIDDKDCFGYSFEPKSVILEGNIIHGPNVRYYSRAIEPKNCIKNLASFIMSSSKLKLFFQRNIGNEFIEQNNLEKETDIKENNQVFKKAKTILPGIFFKEQNIRLRQNKNQFYASEDIRNESSYVIFHISRKSSPKIRAKLLEENRKSSSVLKNESISKIGHRPS
jgi:hypothetical protein